MDSANFNPGFNGSEGTFAPDLLIAGDHPIRTQGVTILSGAGELSRGTLLGKVTLGAAAGAKQSGTGDGTIGAVTLGAEAQVGVYVLTCIAEAADAGTFQVVAPDGTRLADLTVAAAYASTHINLTVADGANDWDIGDIIHVTVAAGSGKYVKSLAAAVDGSQTPTCILGADVDATSADVASFAYIAGDFNENQMTFGTGHTADSVRDGLRLRSIYLHKPVVAE